jgi:2-octaprenyl-3-methyl-6-methoxy-1,4-benzoquinol hydroxylase/2-octaprenylphenol hydroxylase
MNAISKDFDVVIAGAGMVGAAAANLLGRCGFTVALIEAHEPEAFDVSKPVGLRASAISPGSAAILEQAGAWRLIEKTRSCAYRRMRVEEGSGSEGGLDFEAPVFGMERLGTIVENELIQSSLWQLAMSNPMIEVFCPSKLGAVEQTQSGPSVLLSSGEQLKCSLLVGADGAVSAVRRKVRITQDIWEYNQKGVVCVVRKSQDNPGVAWQRFLEGGPLAFLPLADGSSSIVWTLPTIEADRVLSLGDKEFSSELNLASEGWLGEVQACGPRAAFPLTMRLSDRYVANGVVLLGDSAHVVHPLAGQGVNLGLSDVAALVETLIENRKSGKNIADERSLQRFETWRKSESELMAVGIHSLRALFMPSGLSAVRKLGLKLVSKSWFTREAFLQRAAGQGSNAPRLSKGESIQSLMQGA